MCGRWPSAVGGYLNLETSVEPYCGRLQLESEGFFSKIRLTMGVATALAEFLKKNLHLQRIRRPRYGFNGDF